MGLSPRWKVCNGIFYIVSYLFHLRERHGNMNYNQFVDKAIKWGLHSILLFVPPSANVQFPKEILKLIPIVVGFLNEKDYNS